MAPYFVVFEGEREKGWIPGTDHEQDGLDAKKAHERAGGWIERKKGKKLLAKETKPECKNFPNSYRYRNEQLEEKKSA